MADGGKVEERGVGEWDKRKVRRRTRCSRLFWKTGLLPLFPPCSTFWLYPQWGRRRRGSVHHGRSTGTNSATPFPHAMNPVGLQDFAGDGVHCVLPARYLKALKVFKLRRLSMVEALYVEPLVLKGARHARLVVRKMPGR